MLLGVPGHVQKAGSSGCVLWWRLMSETRKIFLVVRVTEVEKGFFRGPTWANGPLNAARRETPIEWSEGGSKYSRFAFSHIGAYPPPDVGFGL